MQRSAFYKSCRTQAVVKNKNTPAPRTENFCARLLAAMESGDVLADSDACDTSVQESRLQPERKSSLVDRVYTVLLVEYDAVVCKLVGALLEKCNYEGGVTGTRPW